MFSSLDFKLLDISHSHRTNGNLYMKCEYNVKHEIIYPEMEKDI